MIGAAGRTILVTGGAGYLGSHVALALTDAGYRVVVIDALHHGGRGALPDDLPLIRADAGDRDAVVATLRDYAVDAVMHFAGSISVPESVAEPALYWRNNALVTLSLAEACLDAGVNRLIFSSTAAVYGDGTGQPLAEDAPTLPVNPYGRSKLAAEQMLADLARARGLNAVCLRYFNVAGADPQGRAGQRPGGALHLIRAACLAAIGARPVLDIYGNDYATRDGTAERDFIHVADLADAHMAAIDYLQNGGPSVTLNVGYGRGCTVREVVRSVERVRGQPLPVNLAPRRPGDPASVVADASRIRRLFDWRPRFDDLDAIVASTLAWEERQQGRSC